VKALSAGSTFQDMTLTCQSLSHGMSAYEFLSPRLPARSVSFPRLRPAEEFALSFSNCQRQHPPVRDRLTYTHGGPFIFKLLAFWKAYAFFPFISLMDPPPSFPSRLRCSLLESCEQQPSSTKDTELNSAEATLLCLFMFFRLRTHLSFFFYYLIFPCKGLS